MKQRKRSLTEALQADYWKSEDLKRGLESLAANGPGAARFEGK